MAADPRNPGPADAAATERAAPPTPDQAARPVPEQAAPPASERAAPPAREQATPPKPEPAPPRGQEQALPTKRAPSPAERSTDQIRQEISDQRTELTRSLSDLRQGVHSARRIPLIVGGALVAGVATFLAVRIILGDDE